MTTKYTTNSNFYFNIETEEKYEYELPLIEHMEEFRQRLLLLFWILVLFTSIAFIEVKYIVKFLELPIQNVKFFQLSPGEYFISTVKISFFTAVFFASPMILAQFLFFLIPGLNEDETVFVLPVLISSLILFILGVVFAYFALLPAAVTFFFNYSKDVLEPFWSFEEYFNFILTLFYTTGLAFQVPIVQVLIGLLGIISVKQMLSGWRYIIFISTVIGALLTPSTDPVTQLVLSLAILLLYFLGLVILFLITN